MDNLNKIEIRLKKYIWERKTTDQSLKKKRFLFLLKLLGNPHLSYKTIHVTGTSGKGSTASYLSSILTQSGYKTGLNLSPHVERITERIRINNQDIKPLEMYNNLCEIEEKVKLVAKTISPPSYFEILTSLAFYTFAKEKVDIAVIEAGIGGRRDITSVVKPEVVIITNVDLDHTEILGESVEKIAYDKAGIIKPKTPVISGAKQKEVREIITNTAKACGSEVVFLNQDLYKVKSLSPSGSRFSITSPFGRLENLNIRLLGLHQVENASMAVLAAQLLQRKELKIKDSSIKEGLRKTYLPARLELVAEKPLVIIDSAHNKAKIEAAMTSIQNIFPGRNINLVLVLKNKQKMGEILSQVSPQVNKIILTELKDYPTPGLLEETRIYAQKILHKRVDIILDTTTAIKKALKETSNSDCLLITGSFYLAGDAKRIISKTNIKF